MSLTIGTNVTVTAGVNRGLVGRVAAEESSDGWVQVVRADGVTAHVPVRWLHVDGAR